MKCDQCGNGMIGPMDWGWSKEVYGCPKCRNMWWPEEVDRTNLQKWCECDLDVTPCRCIDE